MALVLKDRVKELSTIVGTGSVTLAGTTTGYQTFNAAIPTGSTVYYCIASQTEDQWEVGYGTFTAPSTLSRDTVYESSSAGAKVNFTTSIKDVFITYPAEKAIYEENNGQTLIDAGPITVIGANVTTYTSFTAALGEYYGNIDNYAQLYVQNLNGGSEASADFAAYNDLSDGETFFVDMGIASSGSSSNVYPILGPNSGYVISYGDGAANVSNLLIGSGDANTIIFAGSFEQNAKVATFGTDLSTTLEGSLSVANAISVTGAASFGNTVLLSADPTLPLQAATKQYVDLSASTGIHIHQPVRVERGSNLNATYTQGGTTFNITTISGNKTLTTDVNHGLAINDVIWLYSTGGNGLVINTPYFVYSTPALNQMTISANFDGAEITNLTNATGLSYATRANAGVGATLTNAGTQAALVIDGVTVSVADRVLVYGQTTGYENGVYTVTDTGSGSTNWILTRATDQDKYNPEDVNGMSGGDYFFVQEGATGAGESYVCTNVGSIAIGYSTINYTQFSASPTYVGGTNIDISGQTISLTGTVAATNGGTGANTVATGDILYGSAANTWGKLALGAAHKSLVVNGSGTQVEWNSVALNESAAVSGALGPTNGGTGIASYTQGEMLYANAANQLDKVTPNTTTTKKFLSQTGTGTAAQAPGWNQPDAADITGLAPSATTDTANASNISSGTLPVARLTGEYTGITGVGTLANGTWAATTIAVSYGGTGATTALDARTNLGLVIGANVQAYSATLQTVADLSTNGLLYRSAANTVTIASASDIVSQIGSTAVTNATNASNLTGGNITGNMVVANATSPNSYYLQFGDNTGWVYRFMTNVSGTPTVRFSFQDNGAFTAVNNVTAYSDERLKKNWRSVQEGFVEKLAQVKSGIYDRIDIEATQAGASAQAMQELLPEAVQEGEDGTLSLAYGNAALVAAIELAKQVVELKKEIELLKAR